MKLHERYFVCLRAETEVRAAVIDAIEKHGLTYGEVFQILAQAQSVFARFLIRDERESDDPEGSEESKEPAGTADRQMSRWPSSSRPRKSPRGCLTQTPNCTCPACVVDALRRFFKLGAIEVGAREKEEESP